MATFQINDDEWYALGGLPHLAREVYFVLRRYMDFKTGITGIKRKVSLKAITEELYVEPHQGINEFQPSQMQIRRALEWLEKTGLIERDKSNNKTNKQSVFKLILATRDYSVQNKADSNPTIKPDSNPTKAEANNSKALTAIDDSKANNTKIAKADMPPISDIYNTTHNARAKYPMSLDWVPPDKNILKRLLLNAGIPKDTEVTFDVISEFRGFWSGRPDVFKTTHEWTHGLVIQFKSKLQRGKANANSKRSYQSNNDYSSTIERTATDTDWYYGSSE